MNRILVVGFIGHAHPAVLADPANRMLLRRLDRPVGLVHLRQIFVRRSQSPESAGDATDARSCDPHRMQ